MLDKYKIYFMLLLIIFSFGCNAQDNIKSEFKENSQNIELTSNITSFSGEINDIKYSSDLQYALSSVGGEMHLWDIDKEKKIRTYDDKTISKVALSPDGNHTVSLGYNNSIKVWDVISGNIIVSELHNDEYSFENKSYTIDYIYDGDSIFTQTGNKIKIRDAKTLKISSEFIVKGDNGIVQNDETLICIQNNGLIFYNLKTKKEIKSIEVPLKKGYYRILNISISNDKKNIVVLGSDKSINIINTETGEVQAKINENEISVTDISFSFDDKYIITVGKNIIKFWDVNSGDMIKVIEDPDEKPYGNHRSINSLKVLREDKLGIDYADGTIKIWNIETEKVENIILGYLSKGNEFRAFKINPKNNNIYFDKYSEGIVRYIDFKDGQLKIQYLEDIVSSDFNPYMKYSADELKEAMRKYITNFIKDIYINNAGNLILGSLETENGNVINEWDTETGKLNKTYKDFVGQAFSMDIRNDNKRMVSSVSGGDIGLVLWDSESNSIIKKYPLIEGFYEEFYHSRFSSYSNLFVSSCWNKIFIVDSETGILKDSIIGETLVQDVVIHPDKKYFVSSNYDHVTVWDINTCQIIFDQKDIRLPNVLAFVPDENTLVSVKSSDDMIRFWDIETGNEIGALPEYASHISYFEFSADGKYIFTCNHDGTVKIWDYASKELLATIYIFAPHNEDWFVITPEGKYDGSNYADYLYYVSGMNVYDLPEDDPNYEPGLISKIFNL